MTANPPTTTTVNIRPSLALDNSPWAARKPAAPMTTRAMPSSVRTRFFLMLFVAPLIQLRRRSDRPAATG